NPSTFHFPSFLSHSRPSTRPFPCSPSWYLQMETSSSSSLHYYHNNNNPLPSSSFPYSWSVPFPSRRFLPWSSTSFFPPSSLGGWFPSFEDPSYFRFYPSSPSYAVFACWICPCPRTGCNTAIAINN